MQAAGGVEVAEVISSRTSITNGASVPWTLTVTLENPGESDVDLAALASNITVSFEGASTAPLYTVPTTLAGGGTILSGFETDQIVITVASAGTYATTGQKNVTVNASGKETNSGVSRNGSKFASVTVQSQPALDFVSIVPATVSKSSSVGFAVTIRNNATPNGATATLNRANTRLRFGSGSYDVGLQQASPR